MAAASVMLSPTQSPVRRQIRLRCQRGRAPSGPALPVKSKALTRSPDSAATVWDRLCQARSQRLQRQMLHPTYRTQTNRDANPFHRWRKPVTGLQLHRDHRPDTPVNATGHWPPGPVWPGPSADRPVLGATPDRKTFERSRLQPPSWPAATPKRRHARPCRLAQRQTTASASTKPMRPRTGNAEDKAVRTCSQSF